MTKTALNTTVSRVTEKTALPIRRDEDDSSKKTESSTFERLGKNKWFSMTKAAETPSLIGDALDALEECEPSTVREERNEYIGNFMMGDYGNVRQSDGKNVLFADHETIEVPSARDLFRNYSSLQNNTLPVYQRYLALRSSIKELIDTTTSTITSAVISDQERQGEIDYLNYLYDRLHAVQDELDVVENVRLNELHRKAMDQDDADAVKDNSDESDNAYIDDSW